jgi:soluble lytic murein transglycosylase
MGMINSFKSKLKRYINKFLIFAGAMSILVAAADPLVEASSGKLEQLKTRARRIGHARELLGGGYHHSIVQAGENVFDVASYVRSAVRGRLKPRWKKHAESIASAVLAESQKYGFDPLFVVALVETESAFDPFKRGSMGEVGLMQIRPTTAKWLATGKKGASRYGLPRWPTSGKIESFLQDPRVNIRYGLAYLAYLRGRFSEDSRLYLAAYNMGSRNVLRAREKKIWPKLYARRVMSKYLDLYGGLFQDPARGRLPQPDRPAFRTSA